MNNTDIWNDLGNLYLKANAINAAVDAYNKAIEQGFQSSEIYKNLAGAYVIQGNFADSIQLYRKSIELLSDDKEKAEVFTLLGDCYRRMADFDNAIAAFKAAIEIEPGNPALCAGLSEVQRDLEKLYGFDEIDDTVLFDHEEAALDLVENLPRSDCAAGSVGSVSDEGLQSVSEFEITVDPAKMDLPVEVAVPGIALDKNRGYSVWVAEAGDLPDHVIEDEIPLVKHFIADDVEDEPRGENLDDGQNLDGDENREKENGVRATLLLTLGIMHWRNGNLEEADGILQSAINVSIKIKNNWFEALSWHALALVKTAVGDIKAAIHAYLRAVELAPDQIFPWNNIGSLYSSMGSNDKAMAAFQKAITQHPGDSTSWDGLGDIYTKLGRIDDAISAYQLGNIFEKRAPGADAIKSYEKAFDFYKFTIASFEEEVSQTQDDFEQASARNVDIGAENLPNFSVGQTDLNANQGVKVFENEAEFRPGDSEDSVKPRDPDQMDAAARYILWKVAEDATAAPELDDQPDVDAGEASPLPVYQFHVEEMSIEPMAAKPQHQTERSPEQVYESVWISGQQAENSTSWPMVDDQAILNSEILTAELADEQEFQEDIEYQQAAFEEEPYSLDGCAVGNQNCEVSNGPAGVKASPFIAEETPTDESVRSENKQKMNAPQGSMTDSADENHKQVLIETNEKLKDASEGLPPVVSVEPAPKADPERIAGTIASYEVVVKQNPQNVRAWDSLGNLYRITQRNSEAIHAFERAVALEPNKYVYHYQLGTLYAAEGNYTDAIREIQEVVELNPSFIFAHCALASYLRKIGRDGEAQQHIEIALPYMTNEKEYDRACFESIRGDIDKALELLTIALEKKQTTIEWIRRDLDLDFIRQDSRYKLFETRFSQSVVEY